MKSVGNAGSVPIDKQLEVSVGLTQAVLDTVRLQGAGEPDELLREAGIDPDLLSRPENRIPFEQQQRLWTMAVERAGDSGFGLQFARCLQPTSFGLLGYMVMNCGRIADSLDAVVKYQFLAGQGGDFSLQKVDSQTRLRYTPVNPGEPVTAHRVVALLAANVSFGRWLVGEAFRPCRVTFTHAAPPETVDYDEFFACPVSFGETCNELVFPPEVTGLMIPNASEDLLLLLSERANRLLDSLSSRAGISARIASLLATQLSNAVPDKARVASQLGMSERTLQRRLREEGTSFKEILDDTRHYLARELLRNTQLPLTDVATQLGFSEPSAFYRAFRKWEECTPGQYRELPPTL
jgi:AraC-like DNA-binding protein